jgi:hypothetical protein
MNPSDARFFVLVPPRQRADMPTSGNQPIQRDPSDKTRRSG